jgi:hypothetical protein
MREATVVRSSGVFNRASVEKHSAASAPPNEALHPSPAPLADLSDNVHYVNFLRARLEVSAAVAVVPFSARVSAVAVVLFSARVSAFVARAFAFVVVCLLALALAGCRPPTAPSPGRAGRGDMAVFGAEPPPEFIDDSFDLMYPIFLRHKIAQGPKAALWAQRYHRRWVRWVGRIRSFTANGITLREMAITATFDVSLWLNNDERDSVRRRYKVGDVVQYVGRLDSYDDIWRTLYLVNGSVLGSADAKDAGF